MFFKKKISLEKKSDELNFRKKIDDLEFEKNKLAHRLHNMKNFRCVKSLNSAFFNDLGSNLYDFNLKFNYRGEFDKNENYYCYDCVIFDGYFWILLKNKLSRNCWDEFQWGIKINLADIKLK